MIGEMTKSTCYVVVSLASRDHFCDLTVSGGRGRSGKREGRKEGRKGGWEGRYG